MSTEPTGTPLWLVNAYYCSNLWLALVATLGLGAILVARQDILTRTKSEAASLATSMNRDFARVVEPKIQQAYSEMNSKNLPQTSLPSKPAFTRQELQGLATQQEIGHIENLIKDKDFEDTLCRTLNELEAYSIAFLSGTADSEIGYLAYGPVLVDFVTRAYPYIAYFRQETAAPADRPWEELVTLSIWWGRRRR